MNRTDAKKIAEKISNEDLLLMFTNAKEQINDWSVVSIVNKSMSKGTAWNVLASDFNVNQRYHILAKINMVREFGKYLPEHLKIKKETKTISNKDVIHQEPKFKN